MMMDVLDDLQADLDALRDLVIETRIAPENTPEEASSFAALVALMKSQTFAQEKSLRPLADRHESLRQVLDQSASRAHGIADMEEMIECCTNIVTWRASVEIFCELVETHLDKLARDLMPTIYEFVSPKERRKLASAYENLRGFEKPESIQKINWQKIWSTVINPTG